MEYNRLGNTGLEVSTISLGTVSLGVPYGIKVSGEFGAPSPEDSVRLLNTAADTGINLYDTAPAYGKSEQILGRAFSNRPDLYIATKISVPEERTTGERRDAVMSSLRNSLKNLRRDVLDIVQIHNARAKDIQRGEIIEFLLQAREKGLVRFLGASVYGEEAAKNAIETRSLDVLQIAYSILDQRPAESSFSLATNNDTAILVRSALLKGVLSRKARALPNQLEVLKQAAEKVRTEFGCSWDDLPEIALRFCLSNKQVSSVLVGARTRGELAQALSAWRAGPLPEECTQNSPLLALNEESWVNPSYWPLP